MTTQSNGWQTSYDPSLSILPDIETAEWVTVVEFTPSVSGYYSVIDPPAPTATPYSDPATDYPYTDTGSEGGIVYRKPVVPESLTLTDTKEGSTSDGVPSIMWHSEKLQVRLKRPAGASVNHEVSRIFYKTSTVNGQEVITPVVLTIGVGATMSAMLEFIGVVSANPQPGEPTSKGTVLLPVEFKARDQFSDRFDPPLNGDVHTPTGAKDEDDWVAWTSVCRNAPLNVNTKTKVVFGAGVDLNAFEIVPAADSTQLISVSPNSPTGNETNLTITALGGGNTIATATIQVRLKSNHSTILSMKVRLLPERQTVKCRFFKLLDSRDALGFGDLGSSNRWNYPAVQPVPGHPELDTSIPSPGSVTATIDTLFSVAAVSESPSAPEIPAGTTPDGYGLREFQYEVPATPTSSQTNSILDSDAELNNIDQQRGLFTSQGLESKDCIIVYVPYCSPPGVTETHAFFKDDVTGFIFVGVNNWSTDPLSELQLPEDELGATRQLPRVVCHEFGHWLGLSTRGERDPNGKQLTFHDNDRCPAGTIPLMREGTVGAPGRWIRHEDWKRANERAQERGN